jgi:hypothetical protein
MTRSSDPRRKLTSDEKIALLVAFLGIGGVIFWGLQQSGMRFDFGDFSKTLFSTSTTAKAPNASLFNLPKPQATVGTTPQGSVPQPGQSSIQPSNIQSPSIQPSPFVVPPIDQPNPPTAVQPAPTPAPTELPNLVPAPTPPKPLPPPIKFSDVPPTYWAGAYIAELSRRNILQGFDDGSFQPDQPITRAQFASLLGKAFDKPKMRSIVAFPDVKSDYWAKQSIDESIQTGFMSGYPNGVFQPDQQISIVQLQTALATGLNLQPTTSPTEILSRFEDANQVPKWAQAKVAATVESGLVTGFPTPQKLTPNRIATRADAAAMIYQALVKEGRVMPAR